jgi:hypothetical protein
VLKEDETLTEDARKQLTREQREAGVAESLASMRLSGMTPTPAASRDAEDYIAGRRGLDEIVIDAVARPTRVPVLEPEGNPWAEIVGPCYTTASFARELGVGNSAVSRAARELRALRLRTSDGVLLFPAFQLHEGALMPGLAKVLTELRDGFDDSWMWAQWLMATPPGGARSNIEELRAGDVDGAVLAAKHTAWAWKQ